MNVRMVTHVDGKHECIIDARINDVLVTCDYLWCNFHEVVSWSDLEDVVTYHEEETWTV